MRLRRVGASQSGADPISCACESRASARVSPSPQVSVSLGRLIPRDASRQSIVSARPNRACTARGLVRAALLLSAAGARKSESVLCVAGHTALTSAPPASLLGTRALHGLDGS